MKKLMFVLGVGLGGGLIGFFAGRLDSAAGGIMFTAGVFLMVFSAIKLSKE